MGKEVKEEMHSAQERATLGTRYPTIKECYQGEPHGPLQRQAAGEWAGVGTPRPLARALTRVSAKGRSAGRGTEVSRPASPAPRG